MRSIKPFILATFCAALIGCSDDDDAGNVVLGPAADMSEELSGGNGPFVGSASLGAMFPGYVEREVVADGVATSYREVTPRTVDGRWDFETDGSAAYRTRVLLRYPEDPAAFSGTVVVEWLNVSSGLDANPDFDSLEEELIRAGHAWAGVSAQLIGVEGGPVLVVAPGAEGLAGIGLKGIDPARYGTLEHPGDGFSFDIFTQIARALRAGGEVLGGLRPDYVIAAGESQSAIALVTYYNGVHPIERAFDGFFVHSRASVGLPLVGPGEFADLAGSLGGVAPLFRDDVDEPVIELQAEGDITGVLSSVLVRQPDSPTFRLWEAAGTAHADAHLLGPVADLVDCGVDINDGPLHLVAKAAFRHLDDWIRGGQAPPEAPRIAVTNDDPAQIAVDADGIAIGGIRTPLVDVPVDTLSGAPGPSPDLLCLLLGSTLPLSNERIAELYASRAEYEQLYDESADEVIAAGFVLEEDRQTLLDFSQPERVE